MDHLSIPKGLREEPFIRMLLGQFLDKLDKQQVRLSLKVSRKSLPDLYQYNTVDTEYLWSLVYDELFLHYRIITIKLNKPTRNESVYHQAQLYFERDKEALVRSWLDRPALRDNGVSWREAVDNTPLFSIEQKHVLHQAPLMVFMKDADMTIKALYQVGEWLKYTESPLTLRYLSSQCFDANSKVLDGKADVLMNVFPEYKHNIAPRPLLFSIAIPETYHQVVFVENQETWLMLAHHNAYKNTAVVYCAGFLGSAARSRQCGQAVFVLHGDATAEARRRFEQWWFSDDDTLPCYFWGDLDFSGFSILAALRCAFPQVKAWEVGYGAMLKYHKKGIAHIPEQAKKEKQKDPVTTGCAYTDTVLLPLLRHSQRYVDQEVVSLDDLLNEN